MGTSYTGLRVQDTYNAIIKIGDNTNLTGTAKLLSDGVGNDTALYLSTTKLGIGVTPTYQFQTSGEAKIGSNLIVGGNLTVNGTTTIIDSTVIAIGDNMMELAKDNVANTMDIGWYGTINSSGEKYVGVFYDASSGVATPEFHIGLGTSEPSSTASWTTKGKLVIGALDATTGAFSSNVDIDGYLQVDGAIKDSSGDTGTSGQVLSSTGTGTNWVDNSGTIDGSGTANDVAMWSDSDTLTDAPIAISSNNATFAGNISVADSVTVTGSGYGSLELGGPSGGYIDLKAPASDDYDIRIITSSGGNEITTASGDLKINTGNTLALTLDGSNQNATFTGDVKALRFEMNPDFAASNEYLIISKMQNQDGGIVLKSKPSGGSGQNDWQILNHSSTGDLRFYAYGLAGFALTLDRENGNATFAGDVDFDGHITLTGSSKNIVLNYGNEIRTKDSGGTERTVLRASSNKLQYGWSYAGEVEFMGGGSYTPRITINTDGSTTFAGAVSTGGYLTLNSSDSIPRLIFNGGGDDFFLSNTATYFGLYNDTDSRWDIKVAGDGNVTFAGEILNQMAAPKIRLQPTTQNNASIIELGVLNAGTTAYARIDAINLHNYDSNLRFYTNPIGSTTQTLALTLTNAQNADFTGNVTAGTTTTSKFLRAYHSDASYTNIYGYGVEFSRTSAYIRPVGNGTQNMFFGYHPGSINWNNIDFDFSGQVDFRYSDASKLIINSSGIEVYGSTTFSGDISIPQTNKIRFDGSSGHTYISEEADSNLKTYVAGTQMSNITNAVHHLAGKVAINGAGTAYNLNVSGDSGLYGTTYFYNAPAYAYHSSSTTYLQFDADNNYGIIDANNAKQLRINTSGGDVVIGNSVNNPASGFASQKGFGYEGSNGNVEIAATSGNALTVGRNETTDGAILSLRKESNIVGYFGSNTTGGQMLLDIYGSSSNGNIRFVTNGGEVMRMTSSYHMLVGTTSVAYSGTDLHVGNTTDSQNGIQISTSTTGYGYVLFGDGTGANAYRGQLYYNHGTDDLGFVSAGSTRLIINSSGDAVFNHNVGVGETPNRGLSVNSSTGFRLKDTSTFSSIHIGTDQMPDQYPYRRVDSFRSDGTGYYWAFGTHSTTHGKKIRMVINDTSTSEVTAIQRLQCASFASNEYNGSYPSFSTTVRFQSNGDSFITGGSLGIGNTTPSSFHNDANNLVVGTGSSMEGITIYSGTDSHGGLYFADGTSGSAAYRGFITYNQPSDYFALGTAGAERMRITSNGEVCVGNTGVTGFNETFNVTGNGIATENTDGGNRGIFGFFGGTPLLIGTGDDVNVVFRTDNTNRMTIKSNGQVGVGTENPQNQFVVKEGSNVDMEFGSESGGCFIQTYNRTSSAWGYLRFIAGGGEKLRIGQDGLVHVMGASASESNSLTFGYNSGSGIAEIGPTSSGGSTEIHFYTSNSGSVLHGASIKSNGTVQAETYNGIKIKSNISEYHQLFHSTSTNDLVISSAGDDVDFISWIRARNGNGGTIYFEVNNTNGHTGIGGQSSGTYELNVNGKTFTNEATISNTRVTGSEKVPLGHYTGGREVWSFDTTWSNQQLQDYFNNSGVEWYEDSTAPGGWAIAITGGVYVGGQYNSGFPYLPTDANDIYYMECYIRSWDGGGAQNLGHYMGSIDYNHSFSSLGGNPGSYGYWVMSNTYTSNSWVKVHGIIRGFGNSTGQFETGTKYWTPQALFNYSYPGTGTRKCVISGWRVIRINGQEYFCDGSASVPSITFAEDKDTGFFRQTSNRIGVAVGGSEEFRFYDNGELHCDSDVVAFSTTISDARLKDNVNTIENALDKVKLLRGVEYDWNLGAKKGKHDLGVIAQEVEKVLPDIVTEKEMAFFNNGIYKTVDYEKLTAVLIESVKELNKKVDRLEKNNCNCK